MSSRLRVTERGPRIYAPAAGTRIQPWQPDTSHPTVFVVDDDAAARESLSWLLESIGLCVEAYATAAEFLRSYDPERPSCLVVDVRLPGMSGLDLLDELAAREITVPVIVVSAYAEVPSAVRAFKAGAIDFVEKPFCDQVLLDRIQQAIRVDSHARAARAARAAIKARLTLLTPREREVMEFAVAGKANKVIAVELGVAEKTVEVHRARLMRKLQVHSLADLVRFVLSAAR